jgi:membrane-bound inhibitor of C-type lysozyme
MPNPARSLLLGGLAAVPLLLAGCAGGSNGGFNLGALTGGGNDGSVRYRCDDDRSFRVDYNNDRDRATVEAGNDTYRLRLADRDGRRREYGEGDVRLIVDGNEARLRISGGRDYSGCEEA